MKNAMVRLVVRATAMISAAGLLAAAAAGCGEPEQQQPAAEGGTSSQITDVIKPVTGPPKDGGTLVVGLDSESEGFDPTKARFAAASYTIGRTLFDPLVMIGADGEPKPYLAESLAPAPDYRSWNIKLRPGVTFHDGSPLNSAALKQFAEAFKASPTVGSAARAIDSVDIVDDLTVRYNMNQAWATFPLYLYLQGGFVAAPSQLTNPDGNLQPVGTGPFVFKSWERDKALIVERNPNYWRTGVTHLDSITFRPIPDNQRRYDSLKAGDIDITMTPREPTIQALVNDGKAGAFQVMSTKGDNDVNMVMFNTSKPPFDDIRLRQAVAAAIDRNQLLALSNSPPDLAADSYFARWSPWYVDSRFPTYDRAKAADLVQKVEAEKGPVTVTLHTVPDQEIGRNVTVAQALLKDVGIDVNVETVEQSNLIIKAATGDYQFMTWRQFGGVDPDINYLWFHSDYVTEPVALNMARNRDTEIDRALEAGRGSTDPEVRRRAYATVQERLAVDLPYVWLTHLRYTAGAKNDVRNIDGGTFPDGSKQVGMLQGTLPLAEIWLDR